MLLGSGVDVGVALFGVWMGERGVMCSGNSMVIGFKGWPMGYGFGVIWLSASSC